MPISFKAATAGVLSPISAEVPAGAIVGIAGDANSGAPVLLDLAAGSLAPESGAVESDQPSRSIGLGDPLDLAPVKTLLLRHPFAEQDAVARARARVGLEMLRKAGASVLVWTHELDLLRDLCDEVWWLDRGRIAASGDPRQTVHAYQTHVARQLADWGRTIQFPLAPSLRRGDGRARIVSIQTLDAAGHPAAVWQSGDTAKVRVAVAFDQPVEDPVIGIMIRTRIGFEVFGTNTELEQVKLGPVLAGETRTVTFALHCSLCPQEYTLTAASHDPNGVWHDWMEDAVAFCVAAPRYTAGVADLRATVEVTP
ncbi:MAG: Wzt carbohydrate-binding domain-containing protein [Bryobacteraceae bacterium]